MPKKLDDKTYGEKLIRLFAHLLFSNDKYSLNQLVKMLGCSKPTVIRLVRDIQQVYGVQIEDTMTGRERFISMKKTRRPQPAQCLTADEATLLQMCKSFTEHLVGPDFNTMVQSGILKSRQLLPDGVETSADLFASFHHGTIDYTAHQQTITTLIQAMRDLKVCCITYRAAMDRGPKTFYIKPLKMLSHNNTLYVLAQMAKTPERQYKTPRFDPLLAVHRMVQVEMTATPFEFPPNFDFDKVFDKSYGFMQEDHFKVTVRLTGWAKDFMRERVWSNDQKIKENPDGSADITFTAASESELTSFILSLGDKARILKPKWLVKELKNTIGVLGQLYA
jgi:predicted DNA-binding transcriptional regulator YafY